jgi:hypothetical protein
MSFDGFVPVQPSQACEAWSTRLQSGVCSFSERERSRPGPPASCHLVLESGSNPPSMRLLRPLARRHPPYRGGLNRIATGTVARRATQMARTIPRNPARRVGCHRLSLRRERIVPPRGSAHQRLVFGHRYGRGVQPQDQRALPTTFSPTAAAGGCGGWNDPDVRSLRIPLDDPPQTGAPPTLDSRQDVHFEASGPFVVTSQDEDHPFSCSLS